VREGEKIIEKKIYIYTIGEREKVSDKEGEF
jgi:hypothetical protein